MQLRAGEPARAGSGWLPASHGRVGTARLSNVSAGDVGVPQNGRWIELPFVAILIEGRSGNIDSVGEIGCAYVSAGRRCRQFPFPATACSMVRVRFNIVKFKGWLAGVRGVAGSKTNRLPWVLARVDGELHQDRSLIVWSLRKTKMRLA